MCPMDRRPNERAMHESFLVIKAAPSDMGTRPLSGPYTSPDITVGPDGRPRAVVWNLGTREVLGVVTEFAGIPAGKPVHPDNKKVIGYANPANIGANGSVIVTCNAIWPGKTTGEVLLVTAYHPELDPAKVPCDPIADRHVGQFNYPWTGTFEGTLGSGASTVKLKVEILRANQGCFRVRVFQGVNGRLPTNPQVDRTMAPSGASFRWLQPFATKKEDWEVAMVDNQRVAVRCKARPAEATARPEPEIKGTAARV